MQVVRTLMVYGTTRRVVGQGLLVAAAVVAGAALAVVVIARSDGPTRSLTDSAPFSEYGTFDYSAILGQDVYDGNNLRPPQPLFRRLGERLPLRFSYGVTAVSPAFPLSESHGTYTVNAELTQSNLWSRVVPLTPPTAFEGASFDADTVLDVSVLGALVKKLEAETGFKSASFRVRLSAHVDFEARMAGVALVRSHDQVVEFIMSDIEMRLDAKPSTVEHLAPGAVTFERIVPAALTVPLIRTQIPYTVVTPLAMAAMGLAALLVAVVVACTILAEEPAPTSSLAPRYERLVTDVAGFDDGGGGGGQQAARVAVGDLESFFRLAEQYQLPVLRSRDASGDKYWLLADTTYVFDDGPTTASQRAGPAPPAPTSIRRPTTPRPIRDLPSNPPGSEGRAAYPRHSWSALASYADAAGETGGGSLGLALRRGRSAIDGESEAVQSPDATLEDERVRRGRAYWGHFWPQYADDDREDAA